MGEEPDQKLVASLMVRIDFTAKWQINFKLLILRQEP